MTVSTITRVRWQRRCLLVSRTSSTKIRLFVDDKSFHDNLSTEWGIFVDKHMFPNQWFAGIVLLASYYLFFYITNKHTGQSPVFWGDCPLALKQHHANNGRFIKVHNVQSLSSSEICEYEVPLRAYIDSYLHTCQKKNWDGSGAIHLSSWMKPQTEWRIWDTIMYMKCVLPILCGRSEWQNLWKDTFPVSRLTPKST